MLESGQAKAQLRLNVKSYTYLMDGPLRVESVGQEITKLSWKELSEADRREISGAMAEAGWKRGKWPMWERALYAVAA